MWRLIFPLPLSANAIMGNSITHTSRMVFIVDFIVFSVLGYG